jgi:hypothetical protein
MVLQLAAISPEEALQRGFDVFDVTLINWGFDVKDSYPIVNGPLVPNLGFPFTPQGVMIGPRSTVDRCWVSWNNERTIPGNSNFVTREVSVDTPIFFSLPANAPNRGITPAPASLITDAQDKNLLYFFPTTPISTIPAIDVPSGVRSTVIPTTYAKADGSVVAFFGGNLIINPVLELRFFLKSGLNAPPTKRFPYQNYVTTLNPLPAAVEFTAALIPTFGRKNVIIQASCTKSNSVVRIAALRNSNPTIPMQETTEGQKTSTAVNQSLRFQLCDPAADWTIVYVTPGDNAANFTFTVTAYD